MFCSDEGTKKRIGGAGLSYGAPKLDTCFYISLVRVKFMFCFDGGIKKSCPDEKVSLLAKILCRPEGFSF